MRAIARILIKHNTLNKQATENLNIIS